VDLILAILIFSMDVQRFNHHQQALLHEALYVTYGDYSIEDWIPCTGGTAHTHAFKTRVNDRFEVIARWIDPQRTHTLRQQERVCTQRAGDMDIGPSVLYHDAEDHLMLIECLDGTPLTLEILHTPSQMIALAHQLHIWHASAQHALRPVPNLQSRIQHLLSQLKHPDQLCQPADQLLAYAHHHQQHLDEHPQLQPCHMDPNPANVIQCTDGQLKLIDWSESGLGHPYIDIAMIAQYLPRSLHQHWLNLMTGHQIKPEHLIQFKAANQLLVIQCHIWALHQAELLLDTTAPARVETPLDHPEGLLKLQKRWLDGAFNTQDPREYLALSAHLARNIDLTSFK